MSETHESLTIRIVRKFMESNLSMVFIIISIAVRAVASALDTRVDRAAAKLNGRAAATTNV
jgi:hypothetical protein